VQPSTPRHHDGFGRQRQLKTLLDADEPWTAPFIVQLLGEYVIQICRDIERFARTKLPARPTTGTPSPPRVSAAASNRTTSARRVPLVDPLAHVGLQLGDAAVGRAAEYPATTGSRQTSGM
jgi:hypothetical protein